MTPLAKLSQAGLVVALMAISAHLAIPVGPVPITLQTMVCLLGGKVLGARWGAYAMLAYMTLGLMGLPVFSSGAGPAYLLHPTFGYIVGFVGAALYTGWREEKKEKKGLRGQIKDISTALFIIYFFGSIHLYFSFTYILDIPLTGWQLLATSFLPYILQDYVTAFLGLMVWQKSQKRLGQAAPDVR